VGLETPDDAVVYALGADRAVVASLDFFTPIVDDPADFGAIAAANALSDMYAMHARPLFALNVLAVPAGELPEEVVAAILSGAAEVCAEAGIPVGGGHSIDDPEPKFGLVVLGEVHPGAVWRKGGARPGDAIVLGKALGTGVVTTALKAGEAPEDVVASAVASMRRLNRDAMEVLEGFSVHGATDVSGFGLLGHLLEMCRASDLAARVDARAPRLLPGARDLAEAGHVPGGTARNRAAAERVTMWEEGVPEGLRVLLCDAQTSGGLLAAVPPEEGEPAVEALAARGYAAAIVGTFRPGEPGVRVVAS
jgi:selenide,water dikinase